MKRIAIMLVLSTFIGLTVFAKEKNEKVLVDKRFEVNKNALLQIDHQYGNVECKNWNESAIAIKVIATVETSSSEKAEKIFNAIKINLDGSKNGVSVESEINSRVYKNGKCNLSVDIEIFLPSSIRLDLEHEFGNAYVEIIEGETEISVEYGSLEIGELKNESNNIEIGFGSASIGYIKSGDIEVNYSTLELGKSESLSIKSNYSTISLDKAGDLEIENEGGQVEIGKVGVLNMSSKFSDFKVGELQTSLIGETEYGNLSVKKIRAEFSRIEIENSFGSVNMYFDSECVFDIVAEMEYCTLNYPNEIADFSKRIVSTTSDSYYEGTIGEGPVNGSKVDISSEFGGISIFFR